MHSLLLGPASWAPVAQRLRARGATVVVPSLVSVADAEPPYWPAAVDLVSRAVPAGRPVVVVAHSNAGLLVPVVAASSPAPVAACVVVDAAVPAREGASPTGSPQRLSFLRDRVTDGRVPQWTDWWADRDLTSLFPSPSAREAVTAEQPLLPRAYYEQAVPAPAGWDDRPCSYLCFSAAYRPLADEAAERGWTVAHLLGEHLHQLVDPAGVARFLSGVPRRATG